MLFFLSKFYDKKLGEFTEEQWKERQPHLLSVPLIREYQKYLMPEFNGELQNLYFEIVSDMLEYADRSYYKESARILKEMKKDFDVADVQLFVIELTQKYKNRPALLEELKFI